MSLYDEMRIVAKEILSDPDFKQGKIEYVKITPGAGPIDDPGAPVITVTEIIGGVAKGVSFKYVTDGTALSTDLIVTLPVPDGLVSDMKDFIDVDGVRHKIVSDISTPAAGVRVVWKFIIRKGT